MATLYNASVGGVTKAKAAPEQLMPGASSQSNRATQAALAQSIHAAFPNMATAILQVDSEAKADVAFFAHTGANKGGMFSAQLCT